MAERKLLKYREFRKYLETGEAVAVDFIIRDPKGRTLLTYRNEEPIGLHFPGGIVLPGENPEEIVVWVAKKELDWNILEELNIRTEAIQEMVIGEVAEVATDKIRDPRGPVRHRVYQFNIDDSSSLIGRNYENGGGFFENPSEKIISQHKRIIDELNLTN